MEQGHFVSLGTLLVLVFLVGMWVALLAGPVVQSRQSGGRGGDSIKSFQRQLAVLDRSRPGRPGAMSSAARRGDVLRADLPRPGAPRRTTTAAMPVERRTSRTRARQAAQRRRRIMVTLGAAVVTSLLLWAVSGGVFLWLFLLSLASLGGYVGLMVYVLRLQAEREMKVAFLPHRDAGAEPTTLLEYREAAHGRR